MIADFNVKLLILILLEAIYNEKTFLFAKYNEWNSQINGKI